MDGRGRAQARKVSRYADVPTRHDAPTTKCWARRSRDSMQVRVAFVHQAARRRGRIYQVSRRRVRTSVQQHVSDAADVRELGMSTSRTLLIA